MSGIREYSCLVRVKTSITLPKSLITRLDRADKNRSAILERAAVEYLARIKLEARNCRDIEIIELNAESLNREAVDTLEYQRLSCIVCEPGPAN